MSRRTWLALAWALAFAVLCVEDLASGEVRARATDAKPTAAEVRTDRLLGCGDDIASQTKGFSGPPHRNRL